MDAALAADDTSNMMAELELENDEGQADRLYSICFFGKDWVVPEVQFFEAASDQDASDLAGSMKPWMRREVWERHRLVRVLPPTLVNGSRP